MNLDTLIECIDFEIKSLNIIFNDIIIFPSLKANESINNYDKSAIALMLSQFYNGIENIFKQYLQFHNIKVNKNENSHIELFNTFNKIMFEKYAFVFSDDVANTLTILRRFRHYVFHGYSFNLEWDRLKLAIDTIAVVYPKFRDEINALIFKINSNI